MGKSRAKNKSKLKARQDAKKLAKSKQINTTQTKRNPSPSTSVTSNPKTTNTYDRPPSPMLTDHDKNKDISPSSTYKNPT